MDIIRKLEGLAMIVLLGIAALAAILGVVCAFAHDPLGTILCVAVAGICYWAVQGLRKLEG